MKSNFRLCKPYNPHGDTTLLTTGSGQEWIDYSYDAFGGQLDPNGLSFGYTGKWQRMHDSDTKMIRMGVRDYDPATVSTATYFVPCSAK